MTAQMSSAVRALRIIQLLCCDFGILFIFALHIAHPKDALFPTLTIIPLFLSGLFVAMLLFQNKKHPKRPLRPVEKALILLADIVLGVWLLVFFIISNVYLHRRHYDYRWYRNAKSLAFGYYAVMPALVSICIHFYLALHTIAHAPLWKHLLGDDPLSCRCPHCAHHRTLSPSRHTTQPTGRYAAIPPAVQGQESDIYRDDEDERGDAEGVGRRSSDRLIV